MSEGIDPTGGYAILAILLGLSWIFFSLRMYVRFFMMQKPGWDDALVFLSLILYTAFTAFACGLVANGLGEDIDESAEDADEFSRGSFYFFFSELTFIAGSTILRIACAVMLLRLMSQQDTRLRFLVWGSVGVMVLYSIAFFFLTLFQCKPVSYFWTFMFESDEDEGHEDGFTDAHTGGTCINNNTVTGDYSTMAALFVTHSAVCLVCDWTLGLVPFLLLRNIQMGKKKKVLVMVLLSLGVLAGVAALVRCPLIIEAERVEFWDSAVPVAVTTAIEPALGIISICAATLTPLVKKSLIRHLDSSEVTGPYLEYGPRRNPRGDDGDNSTESHAMSTLGKLKNKKNKGANRKSLKDMSETAIVVQSTWMVEDGSDSGDGDSNTSHEGGQTGNGGKDGVLELVPPGTKSQSIAVAV